MKPGLSWVIGTTLLAGACSVVYLHASGEPAVKIAATAAGITSIRSGMTEFLKDGNFHVDEVQLRNAQGETRAGSTAGSPAFDQSRQTLTLTFPWGTLKTNYRAENNRLILSIGVENTSSTDTIQGLRLTPMVLQFPSKVKEYDGNIPLLEHNIGQVAAVKVTWNAGTMAIVGEDLTRPLMIGFPWALDRPANTQFPLSIHTDRVKSYPDSYPTIVRPVAPGHSDRYEVSLRFGRNKSTSQSLVGDVYKRFAATFPQKLAWPDRRPIGAIFLATTPQSWALNPRGWFGDPKVNVTTPDGRAEFRRRVLDLADGAIGIMRDMNAQGAITWDIEGQEFRQATTYIGDPAMLSKLAPEMDEVADEYFARFRAAHLRAGICIRPQRLVLSDDGKSATQTFVADPAALLIDKIAYAKKRWGVTLIYLDSNVNPVDHNPLDASIIQKVANAFPDVLIIPEHSNLRYYAYSAPYAELRHGFTTTPEEMRDVYPRAFSTIYTADGPPDRYKDGLKMAVKQGDSLMYRTWFPDPENAAVKAVYQP